MSPKSFFSEAARQILYGILFALSSKVPGRWTLRHALLIARDQSKIRALLGQYGNLSHISDYYLSHDKRVGDILSTIIGKLGVYDSVAACWDQAEAKISMAHWVKSRSVVLMGTDDDARVAIDAINQVIVKRASDLALALPDAEYRYTWFVFDEFREAGKLDGLPQLLKRGRSKGACVVLGFQDIEGVRDVYGDKVGNELVGQCCNKALLAIDSTETARWASEQCGTREAWEESFTGGVGSSNASQKKNKVEIMLPSEFMELQSPSKSLRTPLHGAYIIPCCGSYRCYIPSDQIDSLLYPRHPQIENFMRRDSADMLLRDWCAEDDALIGLTDKIAVSSQRKPANPLDEISRVSMDDDR